MMVFERMGVHLRPDFEQWIPVDMDMEKASWGDSLQGVNEDKECQLLSDRQPAGLT